MTQVNFVLDSETHTKFKKLCKKENVRMQDRVIEMVKACVLAHDLNEGENVGMSVTSLQVAQDISKQLEDSGVQNEPGQN